ncbi:hypothetical protein S40285_10111 [Stachybotrys chlorohalonatus IBT 40285]|uniref:Uncharacterized protein n=1 Tax=Stachybotrys chlorohalonatus (strain IBT 40285) TaxID=1283841 RepID=A0A084QVN3_STAC4|nr:hypothetical protein S40285_10111 [Stachybotrys chlorohalonata IBT 40285]
MALPKALEAQLEELWSGRRACEERMHRVDNKLAEALHQLDSRLKENPSQRRFNKARRRVEKLLWETEQVRHTVILELHAIDMQIAHCTSALADETAFSDEFRQRWSTASRSSQASWMSSASERASGRVKTNLSRLTGGIPRDWTRSLLSLRMRVRGARISE